MTEPSMPMSDERLAQTAAILANSTRYQKHVLVGIGHELLAEVERLRGALAMFGKVGTEWGIQHPLFGTETTDGPINASAACLARNAASKRQKWAVVTRFAGEWREVDRG